VAVVAAALATYGTPTVFAAARARDPRSIERLVRWTCCSSLVSRASCCPARLRRPFQRATDRRVSLFYSRGPGLVKSTDLSGQPFSPTGTLDRSVAGAVSGAPRQDPPAAADREVGMSGAQQVLAAGPSVSVKGRWQPPGHGRMHGPDVALAIAFVAPYAALFFAFAVYPIGYALWMGSKPSLYADLIAEVYRRVYLPLMTPALVVVATYALVLAWKDYLYQFVLFASEKHMTAAVMQAQLFDD